MKKGQDWLRHETDVMDAKKEQLISLAETETLCHFFVLFSSSLLLYRQYLGAIHS
jgi:hypothetical protein